MINDYFIWHKDFYVYNAIPANKIEILNPEDENGNIYPIEEIVRQKN